jgi:hypothetical protein
VNAEAALAFLEQFLLPLVAGGKVHVGRPLDSEAVTLLQAQNVVESAEITAIERARQALARDLWPYPVPTPLDEVSISLAAGLHNLLFLSHPITERWWVRERAIDRVERFTALCLEQPLPESEEQLVARHTLLSNLPGLQRVDVEVRYWAGSRVYTGTTPPARLLRWQGLRRVRRVDQRVTWLDATQLPEDEQHLLELLLRQSPLTDLLSPDRSNPTFEWLPVVSYLRWPRVARLVCHRYQETGLERVGPHLARAFWRLVDDKAAAPERRREAAVVVVGLVLYLFTVTAMVTEEDEVVMRDLNQEDPEGSLASVLVAGQGCGLLPGGSRLGDPDLERRLRRWTAAPVQQLGDAAGELTQRLKTAIQVAA